MEERFFLGVLLLKVRRKIWMWFLFSKLWASMLKVNIVMMNYIKSKVVLFLEQDLVVECIQRIRWLVRLKHLE